MGTGWKVVLAGLVLGVGAAPAAAATFVFGGTFKPATGASYTALLGGGSFDGSFNIAGTALPTGGTTFFQSFSLNLRDSGGHVLKTLTQGVGTAGGYISADYASIYGGKVVYFYDATQNYLQLVVPVAQTGSGAILANGYSYAQIAPQNQATVAAGTIAVPEAASWAMMLAGLGLVGVGIRRRGHREMQAI